MSWPLVSFPEVLHDVSRGNRKVPQADFLLQGDLAVVDQGKALIAGYTNDASAAVNSPAPVIVFGDHTRAFKFVDFPFAMGADGVKVLQAAPGWDPKYVFHYLSAQQIPNAGYSRHFKFLKGWSIPRPPLDEQRRIAAILDHADALRAKRRQVLTHLDSLTQSIFHDMFGDPANNPSGYPLVPLGEWASKFSDGPFGSNLKSSHYTVAGVPVVRLQNIGVGRYLDSDRAYVSHEHYASLAKHDCRPGDVLIGTLGDPILRATVQPDSMPIALNKADCIQMRVDPKRATAQYACSMLNMPGTLVRAKSLVHGQTRSRISMGRLRGLPLPLAPIHDQAEFDRRISRLSVRRDELSSSIKLADNLIASLQSRAFRGGL